MNKVINWAVDKLLDALTDKAIKRFGPSIFRLIDRRLNALPVDAPPAAVEQIFKEATVPFTGAVASDNQLNQLIRDYSPVAAAAWRLKQTITD